MKFDTMLSGAMKGTSAHIIGPVQAGIMAVSVGEGEGGKPV